MREYEKKIRELMEFKANDELVKIIVDLYLKIDVKDFDEDLMYDLFLYVMSHFDFGKFDQYIMLAEPVSAFTKAVGSRIGMRLYYEIKSASLYLMGDTEKTLEFIEEYIDYCLNNGFEKYEFLIVGNKLTLELELKDYRAAKSTIDYMESMEVDDERNTVLYVNKARYLLELNETEGVLENLERAINRDGIDQEYSNYIEIHFDYAKYYMLTGERDLSIQWFEKTVGLIEKHGLGFSERRIYKELANLLESLEMYKESNEYLRKYTNTLEVAEKDYRKLQRSKANLESYLSHQIFENDLLNEKNKAIEMENTLDFLTGIYNRRYVTSFINERLEKYKETENTFSVLIFDIDDFKNINDSYGHLAGDYVIKQVASTVKACLDRDSIIARTGGDEFIVCFDKRSKSEAYMFAERMRKIIQITSFRYEGVEISLTISGGIGDVENMKHYKYSKLLTIADENLYKAKKEGKNRIIF